MLPALLLERGGHTVAICILKRDGRPVIDAIEHSDGHAASHVGLDVAMEQERTRVDDFVAQSHPGVVRFSGGCGVL